MTMVKMLLVLMAAIGVSCLIASSAMAQCGCQSGGAVVAPMASSYTDYYGAEPYVSNYSSTHAPYATYYAPAVTPYTSYYAPAAAPYTSYYGPGYYGAYGWPGYGYYFSRRAYVPRPVFYGQYY